MNNEINTTVEEMLEDAMNSLDEQDVVEEEKNFVRSHDIKTVRTLLTWLKEKKMEIPLCQRLYIWNAAQRADLLDSVTKNIPCGVLIIAECGNKKYLIDGLQRTTSLMILSNSEDLSKDERKLVLNYTVSIETIQNVEEVDLPMLFRKYNSGSTLSSAVKSRAGLSKELNTAIISLSGCDFLRNAEFTESGKKAGHHELIAECVMIASSGIPQTAIKSKDLCKTLAANEESILMNMESARSVIGKMEEIYSSDKLNQSARKRSFNANFLCILSRIICESEKYSTDDYVQLINYIFAAKFSVKAYARTTKNSAADIGNCNARYNLLNELLENPPKANTFDEEGFNKFVKNNSGKAIRDSKHEFLVDFTEFDDIERGQLFMALNNEKAFDAIVASKYNELLGEAV